MELWLARKGTRLYVSGLRLVETENICREEFKHGKEGIVDPESEGVCRMGSGACPRFSYALSSFHQVGQVGGSIPYGKGTRSFFPYLLTSDFSFIL